MVVSFVRKSCGIFEKKTGGMFVNRVVFTKIVKFIYFVFHEFVVIGCNWYNWW